MTSSQKNCSQWPSPFHSLPWSCMVSQRPPWCQILWPLLVPHLQFSAVFSSADHFIILKIFSFGFRITISTYLLSHCSFFLGLLCKLLLHCPTSKSWSLWGSIFTFFLDDLLQLVDFNTSFRQCLQLFISIMPGRIIYYLTAHSTSPLGHLTFSLLFKIILFVYFFIVWLLPLTQIARNKSIVSQL